ncbi:RNI-like protein [Daedalea quercina L-15889]|uniref:RNI-like protein n=1 Tax=Daedalea quercina L-15889 TaxID=1314783 RepID=A0A165R649_9APHY|nr:RNI-like protein [Daedalea quercina L-15889]
MSFVNRLPLTQKSCYDVTELTLTQNDDDTIIDDDLAHILPWCPNLESVCLTGVPDLSDPTVVLLARSARYLSGLDISGCTLVTDVAILELASIATELEVVRVNGLTTLTDPSVSALARSLTNLRELELSDLHLLTPLSIRDVWTFAMDLQRLKLANCVHLTDKAFPYVPTVASERSASLVSLASFAQEESPWTDGSRPPTWLETLPPLIFSSGHKLAHLRFLDVSNCPRLTDTAIVGIVTYAPRIQHLNLSACVRLTDAAAESVATLQHLHVLAMSYVDGLTDSGVVSIVRHCTKLRSVDISYSSSLTDLAILELATLHQLQRLAASGLPRLTDNALLFMAEHAESLERLHVCQCRRLTLDAVHILVRKLAKLEHLSASGVPALRRAGVERFSDKPSSDYDSRKQGLHRVFNGANVAALRQFLDKEQLRRQRAEQQNIIFVPRADDIEALY